MEDVLDVNVDFLTGAQANGCNQSVAVNSARTFKVKLFIMSLLTFFSGFVFGPSIAAAEPAQIVLLRHAEKPPKGPELSERGWQRAKALPSVFSTLPDLQTFGATVALYGMAPSRDGRSVRSIQTITPLAEALKLSIDSSFQGRDFRQLVREIWQNPNYSGKQVVICWRREEIPSIIEAFGADPIEEVRSNEYDSLWIITPNDESTADVRVIRQALRFDF